MGRGPECAIVLDDVLCSRVHAIVALDGAEWIVRDADSRNGVFVAEAKVTQATLSDGTKFRLGSCEFSFHESADPPTVLSPVDVDVVPTLIRDTKIGGFETDIPPAGQFGASEPARELIELHQLAVTLMSRVEPRAAIQAALELTRARAGATYAAYLTRAETGRLVLSRMHPPRPHAPIRLGESLTRLVLEAGHAVWIANQADSSDALEHRADALCVPLIYAGVSHGALYVYLERGRFRQSHFDFAITVANTLAVAMSGWRRLHLLDARLAVQQAESPELEDWLGDDPAIVAIRNRVGANAARVTRALIRGEPGSGKSSLARRLHRAGARADRPLFVVDCSRLSLDGARGLLVDGDAAAWAGRGIPARADRATLLLENFDRIPRPIQELLAEAMSRAPEVSDGSLEAADAEFDAHVIATSTDDLGGLARRGAFHPDLAKWFGEFEISIPALRDRADDIPSLAAAFASIFAARRNRACPSITTEALADLRAHDWPGNVRELRNTIDNAISRATGDTLGPAEIALSTMGGLEGDSLSIADGERRLIERALARTDQNIPESAKLLGISRATLYRKLEEYGLRN